MSDKVIKNKSKNLYTQAVGRRRVAIARVRIYTSNSNVVWNDKVLKKGDVFVNEIPINEYFNYKTAKNRFLLPFRLTNTEGKFIVTVKVSGGGKSGQLDATIHGISRVLDKIDKEKYHDILKKHDLLTRDARARQRRKVGMGGKSRRKKQSPKR